MFFWTFSLVSPTFSTLSLLKGFKRNMQLTTISQHMAKRIHFPILQSKAPAFDPHYKGLPTSKYTFSSTAIPPPLKEFSVILLKETADILPKKEKCKKLPSTCL